MNKELLIETENRIKAHWEKGDIPYLTHLCGGNEEWLLDFYEKNIDCSKDWVLCSHRTHYHALLYGIGPDDLVDRVLNGKSMFVYGERFICSAIVAGVCSVACGLALAIQQKGLPASSKVFCFVGDGATDEGSFWEALRLAMGRDLPLTFIVEDNGSQCGVSPSERWGDYWPLMPLVAKENKFLKYYKYEPSYPHAGTLGPDGKPTRPPIRFERDTVSGVRPA